MNLSSDSGLDMSRSLFDDRVCRLNLPPVAPQNLITSR